jgi:protein SCO1/2
LGSIDLMPFHPSSRPHRVAAGLLVALAALGPSAAAAAAQVQEPSPSAMAIAADDATAAVTALIPVSSPGPAPVLADLVSPDGSAFDLAGLAGRPTLLFFGYTHCPDVCPLTIGEILGVFELQPRAQAVFVSIDPERDTPAFLAEWSAYLPIDLHPATGSLGAVRRAADDYGVRYARVETSSAGGYTFSHTADVFLVDEQGRLVGTFPFGTPAASMAADISALAGGAT